MQETGIRFLQGEVFYEYYNHTALKAKVDYFIPVIEKNDDTFFAQVDEFKITVSGNTLNDVKTNVGLQIGHHYNFYDIDDISLTKGEKEHKRRLQELFERIEVK